ncbi:hypothetical protein VPH35_110618 [Triticum aestivum]
MPLKPHITLPSVVPRRHIIHMHAMSHLMYSTNPKSWRTIRSKFQGENISNQLPVNITLSLLATSKRVNATSKPFSRTRTPAIFMTHGSLLHILYEVIALNIISVPYVLLKFSVST